MIFDGDIKLVPPCVADKNDACCRVKFRLLFEEFLKFIRRQFNWIFSYF